MNSRRYRHAGGAVLIGLALLASVSCGDKVRQGKGSSYLVIDSIMAASGAKPKEFYSQLASDVQTLVKSQSTGTSVMVPTIFEDGAEVALHAAMKDPGPTAAPFEPGPVNLITVDRYHVTFIRADGRNTPGVDVPYGFDGAMTGTVGKESVTLGFILVRIQAKVEAPLKALVGGGSAYAISTIAEITFYGHDQAGNAVSVTGRIGVDFCDWADPQS